MGGTPAAWNSRPGSAALYINGKLGWEGAGPPPPTPPNGEPRCPPGAHHWRDLNGLFGLKGEGRSVRR